MIGDGTDSPFKAARPDPLSQPRPLTETAPSLNDESILPVDSD